MSEDGDNTVIRAARVIKALYVEDERSGRRAMDKARLRMNQALTLLATALIVMLAAGCDALRALVMGVFV